MTQDRKSSVLIVEDAPENIDMIRSILSGKYELHFALNGEMALNVLQRMQPPDLILLDVLMPVMDGYEVCRRLKRDVRTAQIPVIFLTSQQDEPNEMRGLELGAVDYITKPFSPAILCARLQTHLKLAEYNRALEEMVQVRTEQLAHAHLDLVQRLSTAAEFRDLNTGRHIERMSRYTHIIALTLGMSEFQSRLLLQAAPMHDIGKIGIPDSILLKAGVFTDAERELMQKHTTIGAEIIGDQPSELLQLARTIAVGHHERWDGCGYPHGLAGEEIPVAARITALADNFDALTTMRPYKRAWPVQDSIALIRSEAGKQFDPAIVRAFDRSVPRLLEVKAQWVEAEPVRA
jgi:putative two-component system response regulator